MNRTTTALLAALEAVITVAIGIGVALVPLTVMWAVQFGLGVDWMLFWRAAGNVWLVGNGADLTVTLSGNSLGLPGADQPFQITIAVLGLALLTVLLGFRTGMRSGTTRFASVGVVSAVVVFGILATFITLTSASDVVRPSVWQGIVVPTLVYALSVLGGSFYSGSTYSGSMYAGERAVPPVIVAALRAGTAATAAVFAVSAVIVAILLLVDYSRVIALYEGLQGGMLGGLWLTVGQLVLLPDLVVWAASWLTGPGFAIGIGSSVGPVGTQLGPIPPLPMLGILPEGNLAFGFIGIVVPVLAGFFAAMLIRSRLQSADSVLAMMDGGVSGPGRLVLIGAGIGVVAGIELGLLAWWSSGSAGPGRLSEVGPDPWLVGAAFAAEVGIAAILGMFAGGRRGRVR